MKRLAVLGAGGHGKVAADIAENCGWDKVVFFDDAWPQLTLIGHWTVEGDYQSLCDCLDTFDGVFIAIGNNRIRAEKLTSLAGLFAPAMTLIHPNAVISRYARIGSGSIVMAGAIVNCDASIAEGVILNTGCIIDHDCLIGRCAHIGPGARIAGGVQVGDESWIGIGASVKQLVSVGRDAMIGAGATAVSDVSDGITVVGTPARPV